MTEPFAMCYPTFPTQFLSTFPFGEGTTCASREGIYRQVNEPIEPAQAVWDGFFSSYGALGPGEGGVRYGTHACRDFELVEFDRVDAGIRQNGGVATSIL